MRWYSILGLGLLVTASFLGCGSKDGSEPKKVDIPKTPDGTVTTVSKAISEGKFEAIWQAMPESYQGKVNHLIEEVAEHTDADVYDKVMAVVGKFVQVLSDKQEFILGTEQVKQQIAAGKTTKEEAKEAISAVAGLLGDLQKDIKTTKDLEKLNVEKYLAKIGARIKAIEPVASKYAGEDLGKKMADLAKIKVTSKEVSSDSAKLDITDADGKTTAMEMVRVEGKWVPKDIADNLPKQLDDFGKMIHEKAELNAEQKAMVMGGAGMVEVFLDQMLKATTQEQFNKAVADAMAMAGSGMAPQPK